MLVLYFCHINQKMQTSFSNSREAAWFLLRIRKPNKNIFFSEMTNEPYENESWQHSSENQAT